METTTDTKPPASPPLPAPTGSGIPRLTKEQAVIISGFTGYLCCDFGDMHAEIEKRLGHPVWTHEIPTIMDSEIHPAFKDDFIALCPNDRCERWGPAAGDARIATDLNGWPPSAPHLG